MNAMVSVIANAIADPRMTLNPDRFDTAGMSFADMLALYESVVLAYHGLTGSITGEPNFPGFTWAEHGIAPNAPQRVIVAIRTAVRRVDVRLLLDYSQVPDGSGWTSNTNFAPAQTERNALISAGNTPEAHETQHHLLAPAGAPNFTQFPRNSPAPNAVDFPAEHAVWQATMAAYSWIDAYNAAGNIDFPIAGTDAEQYAYLVQLQRRYELYVLYVMALDDALRSPQAVFNYMQTQWTRYQGDPTLRPNFVSAVNRYFALTGAPQPNGLAEMIAEQQNALRQIGIVDTYGAFFNGYRLQLQPADFSRYTNEQLHAEFNAVDAQLRQFFRAFPSETLPIAWADYLQTVQEVMRFRLFDGITDFETYDFDNLTFLPLVQGVFALTPTQQEQILAAQQEFHRLQRLNIQHVNMSEALLAGQVAPWFDSWLPTRGLRDPIALDYEDIYRVQYEHVLHTIEQIESILNSQWFAENAAEMPTLRLPELDLQFLSQLGEMNIDLPTQRANDALGLTPIRRHIEAERGHVFLYILHEMLAQEVGLDFVAWLVQTLLEAEDIDLAPANESFFTTFINNLIHENMVTDALPNAILALQRVVVNHVNSFLNTPLLSLTENTHLAQLGSFNLTLAYMLGEVAGQHPQSITLGCLFNNPRLRDAMGFAADSWLELLLNMQAPAQENYAFNLADIECPDERREAFLDAITYSLNGMAEFLGIVFGRTTRQIERIEGEEFDSWQKDLVVGLAGVTAPINNLLNNNPIMNGFNAIRNLLGMDPVVVNILLPDLSMSHYVRPGGLFELDGLQHDIAWTGEYDSRVGVSSEILGIGAYGRLILPLFELLGLDELILYSEAEFNANMQAMSDAQDIAQLLTRSIFEPLLNWSQVFGQQPLSNLLDFLPNFALLTQLAENTVIDVISDLQLSATVHMAGASGDALNELTHELANYLQFELFELNFFVAMFGEVFPDLINLAFLNVLSDTGLFTALLSEPLGQIALLHENYPGSFAPTFLNRGACDHVTILEGRGAEEPDWDIVRPATLGSLAGFFGGDTRAFTFDFSMNLGESLNAQLPLIDHFSGVFTSLLALPEGNDFTPTEPIRNIFDVILDNPHHSIAWLVELFNMQRYPARDFMRYAWVEQAQARNPVHNPVEYSLVWTREMADKLADMLPNVLNNFADLFLEADNFLELLNLPELDRPAIFDRVFSTVEPHIPMLRIMLLEEDILLLGDMIGFSGYDGYRHGMIPILEAFGVPQRYILPHDEFMAQAADCDEQFIRLIVYPLLDVLERVLADPLHEIPRVLPNILYFMAAEEDGRGNNFVQAVNRMLRPFYAIVDMLTPIADVEDVMALLGIEYPFVLDIAGVTQELRLPIEPALNTIFTNMLRNWFGDFTEEIGLSLELEDLLDLVTGTLSIFRSVNGQNDAVRLETDLPDAFTHLARQLIPMILSDENWAEMRLLIAARLPANTRDAALNLLDGLAVMLATTDSALGPDLVLATLFYVLSGADCVLQHLLSLRQFYRQIRAFFEGLAQNDLLWILALTVTGALATVATVSFFRVLAENARHRRNANRQTDVLAAYDTVPMPPTGDSNAALIVAAVVGSLAVAGALILLKKPQRRAQA